MHGIHLEFSLRLYLNHIPIDLWLGSCTCFLRKETWNTLWALILAGNAILYVTSPIWSRISNDPPNLGANLAQLLSFKELHFGFIHKYTLSQTLNSLGALFKFAKLFYLSWVAFKFFLIFPICYSISIIMSSSIIIMLTKLSQFTRFLHLIPYNTPNGFIPNGSYCPFL